jgi:hypothetical protein
MSGSGIWYVGPFSDKNISVDLLSLPAFLDFRLLYDEKREDSRHHFARVDTSIVVMNQGRHQAQKRIEVDL